MIKHISYLNNFPKQSPQTFQVQTKDQRECIYIHLNNSGQTRGSYKRAAGHEKVRWFMMATMPKISQAFPIKGRQYFIHHSGWSLWFRIKAASLSLSLVGVNTARDPVTEGNSFNATAGTNIAQFLLATDEPSKWLRHLIRFFFFKIIYLYFRIINRI